MAENWNGTDPSTHSVIFNYPDAQSMLTTFNMMSECRAGADLVSAVTKYTTPHSQILVRTLVTGGDYTKDTAYIVWQMSVSDEAAYVAAYEKLMAAQTENGLVNGAYGLWRVQGGADENITHIAYAGAPSMATLMDAGATPSKAVMTFQRKVGGIRAIYRQSMNSVMADM